MTADADLAADGARWRSVDDGVMGGISSSTVSAGADGLRFSGVIRTEFNGGFASVRRELASSPNPQAKCFTLSVLGDGHRYRLVAYVRDAGGLARPYAYYADFDTTAGATAEVALAPTDFHARFRGRPVPEAPPLTMAEVIGVGLMLTKDGHRDGAGSFSLTLLSLRAG